MDNYPDQIGPFHLYNEIGRSALYIDYRAENTETGREVTLKLPGSAFPRQPARLTRFVSAGQRASGLEHPNITQVYAAGEADGYYYIASAYVAGERLTDLLANRETPLEPERALEIVSGIAAALDYAHGKGVEHEGLTTDNVIIDDDGRILVTDFCLAEGVDVAENYTDESKPAFETFFLAPEQLRRDTDSDHRADVFSLGVVAYAMLTRRLPFEAETQGALLRAIINDPPYPPQAANPELPTGLAYVLRNALAKEADVRYGGAGEFYDALVAGLAWNPTPAAAASVATSGGGRRWGVILIGLIGLLLVAGGAFFFLRPGPQTAGEGGGAAQAGVTETPAAATAETIAAVTATHTPAASQTAAITTTQASTATSVMTDGGSVTAGAIVTDAMTNTAQSAVTETMAISVTDAAEISGTSTETSPVGVSGGEEADGTNGDGADVGVKEGGTGSVAATAAPTATSPKNAVALAATATPVPTKRVKPTATATNTPKPTATATNTPKPTATATNTPKPTATVTNTPKPTATATNTPKPTATATNTPKPTATATNTPKPTATATNTPKPTATATNTPKPTATATNTPKPTATATNTPKPTATVTNTPKPTATVTNTPLPLPTPTFTPAPTNTRPPTPTATNTPTSTPIPVGAGAVQLRLPLDGSSGNGNLRFEWTVNVSPGPGQAFELVFWRPDQDPVANGFGMAAPTTNDGVTVDLNALDNTLGDLLEPGDYKWGLLLVQTDPYQRIQFLGAQNNFRFYREGGSSSGGPSSGE